MLILISVYINFLDYYILVLRLKEVIPQNLFNDLP